jgi:hypothetical protein
MSNIVTEGGWNEYQRLVLAELERLNRRQDAIERTLQELDRKFYVLNERDLVETKKRLEEAEVKLTIMEKADIGSAAVVRYRKWIIVGIFTVLTALLIPVVTLIVSIVNAPG